MSYNGITENGAANNHKSKNSSIVIREGVLDEKPFGDQSSSPGEGGNYWKLRYDKLMEDYTRIQKLNQDLEQKLLNVAEKFNQEKERLECNIEHEKSTLMADVNKLSTKLVDARIKLHDYEEKELIHASECSSPCHKFCPQSKSDGGISQVKEATDKMPFDPNLV